MTISAQFRAEIVFNPSFYSYDNTPTAGIGNLIKNLAFDKGRNCSIEITHEMGGFLISYQAIAFDDIPLEAITDFKSILERVKRVAKELKVSPSEFILEFQYEVGRAFCTVDKEDIVYLSLPIKISKRQIVIHNRDVDDDYLLYHELMHAKEVLDGRFPSCGQLSGPQDIIENLVGRLNDFANEGKLEAMGKPHQSKEIVIENVYNCFREDCYEFGDIPEVKMRLLTKEAVTKLCNKVWGKELTVTEAEAIINELINS